LISRFDGVLLLAEHLLLRTSDRLWVALQTLLKLLRGWKPIRVAPAKVLHAGRTGERACTSHVRVIVGEGDR
jgi:hypothetical protein